MMEPPSLKKTPTYESREHTNFVAGRGNFVTRKGNEGIVSTRLSVVSQTLWRWFWKMTRKEREKLFFFYTTKPWYSAHLYKMLYVPDTAFGWKKNITGTRAYSFFCMIWNEFLYYMCVVSSIVELSTLFLLNKLIFFSVRISWAVYLSEKFIIYHEEWVRMKKSCVNIRQKTCVWTLKPRCCFVSKCRPSERYHTFLTAYPSLCTFLSFTLYSPFLREHIRTAHTYRNRGSESSPVANEI